MKFEGRWKTVPLEIPHHLVDLYPEKGADFEFGELNRGAKPVQAVDAPLDLIAKIRVVVFKN